MPFFKKESKSKRQRDLLEAEDSDRWPTQTPQSIPTGSQRRRGGIRSSQLEVTFLAVVFLLAQNGWDSLGWNKMGQAQKESMNGTGGRVLLSRRRRSATSLLV
jgi:hypothetical protein